LTTLKLGYFAFQGVHWDSFHFPNLTELEVIFDSGSRHAEIYSNMMKIDCPQLKKLKLWGRTRLTAGIYLVLNNFRHSLVELCICCPVRLGNAFEEGPLDIQELPKLVRLTLTAKDVGSELWQIFQIQFPNLKDLRFLKLWSALDQELLDNERRRFFTIFPRLKRLTWMAKDDDYEVPDNCGIVFTRESIN